MAIFSWRDGSVPKEMLITQVYGLIFSDDGRLLLLTDGNKCSLAGGKPEEQDNDIEETLRRELIEEVNVLIDKPYIVGYQLVDDEDGTEPFAQVRMAALITEIKPSRPDPATGKTFGRVLVSPSRASELLNWGDVGISQVRSAVQIAKKHFNISWTSEEETAL